MNNCNLEVNLSEVFMCFKSNWLLSECCCSGETQSFWISRNLYEFLFIYSVRPLRSCPPVAQLKSAMSKLVLRGPHSSNQTTTGDLSLQTDDWSLCVCLIGWKQTPAGTQPFVDSFGHPWTRVLASSRKSPDGSEHLPLMDDGSQRAHRDLQRSRTLEHLKLNYGKIAFGFLCCIYLVSMLSFTSKPVGEQKVTKVWEHCRLFWWFSFDVNLPLWRNLFQQTNTFDWCTSIRVTQRFVIKLHYKWQQQWAADNEAFRNSDISFQILTKRLWVLQLLLLIPWPS